MSDCIFCKIINGEIPGNFVFRDQDVVVFKDINPKAPVHLLVVPLQHIESLINVSENESGLLGKLMITVHQIAKKEKIDKEGYKVVINNGAGSGQLVNHLHLHLLGGWKRSPGWEV